MIPDDFMLINFWLNKIEEKSILKISEWAMKSGRIPEELTQEEIREAIKSQAR